MSLVAKGQAHPLRVVCTAQRMGGRAACRRRKGEGARFNDLAHRLSGRHCGYQGGGARPLTPAMVLRLAYSPASALAVGHGWYGTSLDGRQALLRGSLGRRPARRPAALRFHGAPACHLPTARTCPFRPRSGRARPERRVACPDACSSCTATPVDSGSSGRSCGGPARATRTQPRATPISRNGEATARRSGREAKPPPIARFQS